MNAKRTAAIIGLICMGVGIVGVVLSGVLPALSQLLQAISLMAFLVGASISLFFYFRKKEQESDPENRRAE